MGKVNICVLTGSRFPVPVPVPVASPISASVSISISVIVAVAVPPTAFPAPALAPSAKGTKDGLRGKTLRGGVFTCSCVYPCSGSALACCDHACGAESGNGFLTDPYSKGRFWKNGVKKKTNFSQKTQGIRQVGFQLSRGCDSSF